MNYPKKLDPTHIDRLWERLSKMYPYWAQTMGKSDSSPDGSSGPWFDRLQEFTPTEVFNGLAELINSNQQTIPSLIQFVDFVRLGMQKSKPQKKKEEWKHRTEAQKKNGAEQCKKMREMLNNILKKTEVRVYDRNQEIGMDDVRHLHTFFKNVYGASRAANHVTKAWYDELVGLTKGQLETGRYLVLRNYNPDSPGAMPDALGFFKLCTGETVEGFER